MRTIVGEYLHRGEFEEKFDRCMALIDRQVLEAKASGDFMAERTFESIRTGMNLLAGAMAKEWHKGILTDPIPVYNLGIVDRPTGACVPADSAPGHEMPDAEKGGGMEG